MEKMSNLFDRLYIKAKIGAQCAKQELNKLREEDEGLDIIITIILVAIGMLLVGILMKYAQDIIDKADSEVTNVTGNSLWQQSTKQG